MRGSEYFCGGWTFLLIAVLSVFGLRFYVDTWGPLVALIITNLITEAEWQGDAFFLGIRALTGTNFSRPNELSTSDAAAPRRTSPTSSRNYGNLLLWPGPFKVLPTQDRILFVSEKSTFCSPHTRTSTAAIVCACGMESAGANCAKSGVRTLGVAREFCWRIPIVGVGIFGGTLLSRCQAQLFMF